MLIPEVTESNKNEQSNKTIIAYFPQTWHKAMTGKTIPAAQIREVIYRVLTAIKTCWYQNYSSLSSSALSALSAVKKNPQKM